jgi:hypothetical protein
MTTPGIQKWTRDGSGMWSLQTTFNLAGGQTVSPPVGFRGLAILGQSAGGTAFIASTVEPGSSTSIPANHLAVFVDGGGPYTVGSSGTTEIGEIVAQAPASTVYRGLALSPQ